MKRPRPPFVCPPGCAVALLLAGMVLSMRASDCTRFDAAVSPGAVAFSGLKEASGLAVSRRNPGVFWTHNDGDRKKVFALNAGAELLGRFSFGEAVDDVEDMATGPGPVAGGVYLYFGDIGGGGQVDGVRTSVKIIRVPEPALGSAAPDMPPSVDFSGVESFTLTYPDGAWDAETLLVDPVTADLFVITKQKNFCRLYRARLNAAAPGATVPLTFVEFIAFSEPSGGDISPDGSQIVLRRESAAGIWNRSAGESVEAVLARQPAAIPVVGVPVEPNGEAIALLSGGAGYVTISEGEFPPLYFFAAQCPHAPVSLQVLTDQTVVAGGSATFRALITGQPAPVYSWTLNGQPLPSQTSDTLTLTGLQAAQAGRYELTAANASGTLHMAADLTVQENFDLRLTELEPQPASGNPDSGDWWELTNFDKVTVNLAGWRFNDDSGDLATAHTLPEVMIAPGESVVFVEDLTPARFRTWWGAAALPPGLQIIRYSGPGLAFSANGDGFRLWNATTTNPAETVISVDFGPATAGVSFSYDPVLRHFGGLSQPGVNGAFRAAAAADTGSPGRYRMPPVAPVLTLSRPVGSGLRLNFLTIPSQRYELEVSDAPGEDPWSATGQFLEATDSTDRFFDVPVQSGHRFYRVRVP